MILGSDIGRLLNKLNCWGPGGGPGGSLGGASSDGTMGGQDGNVSSGGGGFGPYISESVLFDPIGSFSHSEMLANNAQSNNYGAWTGFGDGYQDPGFASDFSGAPTPTYSMANTLFDDFIGLPVNTFKGGYSYGNAIGKGMEYGSLSPQEAYDMIGQQGYGLMGNVGANLGGLVGSLPSGLSLGMMAVPGMSSTVKAGMGINSVLSALTGQNPFGGEPDAKVEGGPPTPLTPLKENAPVNTDDSTRQTKQNLNIQNDFDIDRIIKGADPFMSALDFLRLSGVI